MDATTLEYGDKRYNEIKQKIFACWEEVGYQRDNITFIPISGSMGDNLNWYRDQTLIEELDKICEPNRLFDKHLRLSLEGHVKVGINGTLSVGRIETGILKPGMKVTIGPTGLVAKVNSIGINPESVQKALPEDIVGIHLNKKIDVKCGYVASKSNNDPAKEVISFESQLFVLNCPGGGRLPIPNEYRAMFHCHNFSGEVKFEQIMSKFNFMSRDKNDQGRTQKVDLQPLKKGDLAMVKMVPMKPMFVESFEEHLPVTRFIITDHMKQIVGVGLIMSVEKRYKDRANNWCINSIFIKGLKLLGDKLVEVLIYTGVEQIFQCLCHDSENDDNK